VLDGEVEEIYGARLIGDRSSAWLEPQIVDLAVAGSNPVGHPILIFQPELDSISRLS
jgi:hypothetical protein